MKTRLSVPALLVCSAISLPTHADFSASVDIANLYLFRGLNLSQGSPVVAGNLNYRHSSGLNAGVWSSSGDDTAGTEVNYHVGFSGEMQELGYHLQYLNYYYPASKGTTNAIVNPDDFAEVTAALDYRGLSASATAPTRHQVAGKYVYYTLAWRYRTLAATLGLNAHQKDSNDYSHLDVAWQFNDNLSFVISQVLDKGRGSTLADATLWQVRFQLPITF